MLEYMIYMPPYTRQLADMDCGNDHEYYWMKRSETSVFLLSLPLACILFHLQGYTILETGKIVFPPVDTDTETRQ